MKHHLFSKSYKLENPHEQVQNLDPYEIDKLQNEKGTDIYLCGGIQFAS